MGIKINPALIIAGLLSAMNPWQRRHQIQSSTTRLTGSGGSPSKKYNFEKAKIRRKMAKKSRRINRR